jgi:hypothetical protein
VHGEETIVYLYDWIIKDAKGNFSVKNPDDFELTYEQIEE